MYKYLVSGLVIGVLVGFGIALHLERPAPPRWIVFPNKYFFNAVPRGGDLSIQGRLNDDPAYPNNVVYITCRQSSHACEMLRIEEIDRPDKDSFLPQIGDIHPPHRFEVTHWDQGTITASDRGYDTCEVRQLNIDVVRNEAEIVIQPQNLADMECKNTNPTVVRYPIEDRFDSFKPKP